MLIALMTRIPEPGKTKTRLQPDLSGEECALFHGAFIKDMIAMLDKTSATYQVFHTTDGDIEKLKLLLPSGQNLVPQIGLDLGEKMFNALCWGFHRGFKKVAVLGTDLPALQPEVIEKAEKLLDDNDVVIGPSNDGGYYFLGMKKPFPQLFRQSLWGTASVFQETIKILEEQELKWARLPMCSDIDYCRDLINLDKEIEANLLKHIPQNTYKLIKGLNIYARKRVGERDILDKNKGGE